jgi:predicted transposase/invertase (TIGR01784 family)
MATDILMNISSDPNQRALYLSRLQLEQDEEHKKAVWLKQGLTTGRAEGRAEGLAIGLATGRTEGQMEKSFEIARKLLAAGDSIDKIAMITDLSRAEIEALR